VERGVRIYPTRAASYFEKHLDVSLKFEDPAIPMLHEAIGVAMWAAAILAM